MPFRPRGFAGAQLDDIKRHHASSKKLYEKPLRIRRLGVRLPPSALSDVARHLGQPDPRPGSGWFLVDPHEHATRWSPEASASGTLTAIAQTRAIQHR